MRTSFSSRQVEGTCYDPWNTYDSLRDRKIAFSTGCLIEMQSIERFYYAFPTP